MRTNTIILLALAVGAVGTVTAQDAHLAQYDAAPVLLSPALTGMYEQSDFRMSSSFRSQWGQIGANFVTTTFSYDAAFQNRYGAGLYLSNYNMADVFNTFEVGLSGAYNVSGPKAKHTLSVGLKLGAIQKKVNDGDLLYDLQYNNGNFDSDLPTGEADHRRTRWLPELGLGLAYRSIDPKRRFNVFGNFAAYHVTTPDESIYRATRSDLPIRWSFQGGVVVRINDQIQVTPMGLLMLQNNDKEINAGFLGKCAMGSSAYSILFGGSYRFDDAAIIHLGLKHKNNAYRFSYDVNVSPLREYTNNMGAFEFSIMYYGNHSGRDKRVTNSSF